MASMKKRASGARLQHSAGNVSHDAEQRVHKRVIEIMTRRAAESRGSRGDQASAEREQGSMTDRG